MVLIEYIATRSQAGDRKRETPVVSIRAATAGDARAIAEVHVASWRAAYRGIVPDAVLDALSVCERAGRWASRLANPDSPSFVYVAEDDAGRVVGFASGGPRRDGDPAYVGELYAIYLLPAVQGKGIGRRLAQAVAHRLEDRGMRSMLVWVLATNPARRFYEALGGRHLGAQPFEMGGATMTEVAYGWPDIRVLLEGGDDAHPYHDRI
jgi:GNAT superfamily N-acetyltransferase